MTPVRVLFTYAQIEHRTAEVPHAFRAGSHRGREKGCRARRVQGQKGRTGSRGCQISLEKARLSPTFR